MLDELRAKVRLGTVGRVYTFKLDRITRSGVADTFEVVEEMRRNKCELICVMDAFRFDDNAGADAVIFALSLGAKLERSAINDRIGAARTRLEEAVRSGSRKGHVHAWGRPLRGYSKKDRANGVRPVDLDRVRRMRAEGKSPRDISVALKVPRTTIKRALARAE